MPHVLAFASEHMAWLHGQVGILAGPRLHTSQLIHADRAFSSFGSFGRICIDLTPIANLLVALPIRHLVEPIAEAVRLDRKSTRLNSSHANISYAVFCLKKKKTAH